MNLRGKAVIVTGGTSGIGLATGLAFGRAGARVWLTHRWGSADEDEVRRRFAEADAPEPRIVEADASNPEDTTALLERVKGEHEAVEALISNVSFAPVTADLGDLTRKGLHQALRYSAWPFVAYLQAIRRALGRWPRYGIGISSIGPSYYLPGYDLVAAAKTVMETLCRYLTASLAGEDIRLNIVRGNPVLTPSLEATFGPEFAPFCQHWHQGGFFVGAEELAGVVLALASGWLDGVKGQVLTVDHGAGFDDNVVRLFRERESLGLEWPGKGE